MPRKLHSDSNSFRTRGVQVKYAQQTDPEPQNPNIFPPADSRMAPKPKHWKPKKNITFFGRKHSKATSSCGVWHTTRSIVIGAGMLYRRWKNIVAHQLVIVALKMCTWTNRKKTMFNRVSSWQKHWRYVFGWGEEIERRTGFWIEFNMDIVSFVHASICIYCFRTTLCCHWMNGYSIRKHIPFLYMVRMHCTVWHPLQLTYNECKMRYYVFLHSEKT